MRIFMVFPNLSGVVGSDLVIKHFESWECRAGPPKSCYPDFAGNCMTTEALPVTSWRSKVSDIGDSDPVEQHSPPPTPTSYKGLHLYLAQSNTAELKVNKRWTCICWAPGDNYPGQRSGSLRINPTQTSRRKLSWTWEDSGPFVYICSIYSYSTPPKIISYIHWLLHKAVLHCACKEIWTTLGTHVTSDPYIKMYWISLKA